MEDRFGTQSDGQVETGLETLSAEDSVRLMVERGLLIFPHDESGGIKVADYQFSQGVLPPDVEELFFEYSVWVNRHENTLESAKDSGTQVVVLNTALQVFDTARSRRHNTLAIRLKELLGLSWEHEKVRKLVATMARPLIYPWIVNEGLTPQEQDVIDIANGLARLQRSPGR